MIIVAGGHFGFCQIMQNAQPTTNCATRIFKVNYLSISKKQKKIGVFEMQGSGTGNLTTMSGQVLMLAVVALNNCNYCYSGGYPNRVSGILEMPGG